MSEAREPFIYHAVDIRQYAELPHDWQAQVVATANQYSKLVALKPLHSTSRESADVSEIQTELVDGLEVKKRLPWLYDAYRGVFCRLGSLATGAKLYPAQDDRSGVVLNVMSANTSRYEVHVDTNAIQGMLYVSNGQGGELVVAHNVAAIGVEEVEADASVVQPVLGQLTFFDGRRPHYVRAVSSGVRVAIAMNYYDDICTETERPTDLTEYLTGS